MKIITRYLFREVFHHFRLFIAIFTVVVLVQIIYDNMGDILGAKQAPPVTSVVMLLIYSLPEVLSQSFFMICLLATIFSYGLLAKNKEILAMVASGVSFYRLAVPAFIFGIGLTGFMFWFNESVVPEAARRANYIMKIVIKREKESALTGKGDQLVKGKGTRFYYMERYDAARKEMVAPTIVEIDPESAGITQRIDGARGAMMVAQDNSNWLRLTGGERWTFHPDGRIANYTKLPPDFQIRMEEENLDAFLSRAKKPAEMNYPELREYVTQREAMGDEVDALKTQLHLKLTFPLSCLLMALLGFSVVADVHARRFARGVTFGLIVAIGYYLLSTFFTKLGEEGSLPPLAAGWIPLGIFLVVVAALFSRLKRIRG